MSQPELRRLNTGIAGLDAITDGGLPVGRTTLVAGTAGSGKTLLALQYIVTGITAFDQPGVIVSFEEPVADLKLNVASLGWDLGAHEEDGRLAFVDASPEPGEEIVESGNYDLSALIARIEFAVNRVGAKRVVLDAIGAIFPQFHDSTLVRRELHRIAGALRRMDVTSLLTVERREEYGAIASFGVEEFVADNVVILRNQLDQEKRRRTIEVLKLRGASHRKGEFPFTVGTPVGITIMPLASIKLTQPSTDIRISSGNAVLDEMCGGGMFQSSVTLISGATGTGKTLMTTEFIKAAVDKGQRAVLFAYEESYDQLLRNARSWGMNIEEAEAAGTLKIICRYSETMSLEEHLLIIRDTIDTFKPDRVAIDSMSALERGAPVKSFRDFVISVTGHIKAQGIPGIFTNTTSMLLGGSSISETHISTITDSIILLRYIELYGEMHRGVAVLKMRGSQHQKCIRRYSIDSSGLQIEEPFQGVNGILSGAPTVDLAAEKERLANMFGDQGANLL